MGNKLIPSYTISEFRKLKATELKKLKCCEITSDGSYLFTFVNPTTPYIRTQAEYLGQLSNSNGNKTLEQILHPPEEPKESAVDSTEEDHQAAMREVMV